MDFQDLILGYAIIKNGKITCCSNDLKRLLEDKGTFWTDYDKKEFPLWVELTPAIHVKIYLLEEESFVAIFHDKEAIDEILEKKQRLKFNL